MNGTSIIIPVHNKLEVTQKCIKHLREFNKGDNYEIIIVDNASTDSTQKALSKDNAITYLRNNYNSGISNACNKASLVAKFNILCFMHNDVFVFEKNWVNKVQDFIYGNPKAGIVGLYGAKKVRSDGSFRGKTIVHSKRGAAIIRRLVEKVAVVDGLLMAAYKPVFETVGGFNEDFSIHYYDKDLSMRALKNGYMNYIINIAFDHHCATTRKEIKNENTIRDEAQKKFIELWGNILPADVSTLREKMAYILRI